jgi:hypothetical protein
MARTPYHAPLALALIGFGVWLCWDTAPREPAALVLVGHSSTAASLHHPG